MILTEFLPNALAIGISEDQFWEMNPRRLEPYREAEIIKAKQKNFDSWLHNLYTFEAVSKVVGNAFREKGQKAEGFSKEPYQIFELTDEEKAEKAERELQKALAFFGAMETSFNSKPEPKVHMVRENL